MMDIVMGHTMKRGIALYLFAALAVAALPCAADAQGAFPS